MNFTGYYGYTQFSLDGSFAHVETLTDPTNPTEALLLLLLLSFHTVHFKTTKNILKKTTKNNNFFIANHYHLKKYI